MADTTIGSETLGPALDGTEDFVGQKGSSNYRWRPAQWANYVLSNANADLNINGFTTGFGGSSGTPDTESVAVGTYALRNNVSIPSTPPSLGTGTGIRNTAVGYIAMNANTSGYKNAAFGYQGLRINTSGFANAAFGYASMNFNTTGGFNSALGYQSMHNMDSGTENTGIGSNALYGAASWTGTRNTAVGAQSGLAISSGTGNTAAGYAALATVSSGSSNTGVGFQALVLNNGNNNTAVGLNALFASTGNSNVAIGAFAGRYETGSNSFYVNNQDRTNTATEKTTSLLYGVFAATAASQSLTVNAGTNTFNGNIITQGVTATSAAAPTIASAATIAPTTAISFISGTTTISTITPPSPISAGGGQITLIPTGLWSTNTAGNIALATTGVVSKALILTYDATTTKWHPSY